MRFIEFAPDGKLQRNSPSNQGGLLYWVDETGSYALVSSVLYRDGQYAAVGDHDLPVPGDAVPRRYHVIEPGVPMEGVLSSVRGIAHRSPGAPGPGGNDNRGTNPGAGL